jgi:hypothetical protein
MWYLLIPVVALVGYEFWTRALYHQDLIFSAVGFANDQRIEEPWTSALVGLSFTGGCTLSVLTFCPLPWSRKAAGIAAAGGALAASALLLGWVDFGRRAGGELAFRLLRSHWELVGSQLALFIAGGLLTLALTVTDFWKRRDANSMLLGIWVVGTFVFSSFLNWTVNARTVLPLIPAAGILIARRLETTQLDTMDFKRMRLQWARRVRLQVAGALAVSAALSIWLVDADTRVANLAREAAYKVESQTRNEGGTLWYDGHWGFQYYMDQLGALPMSTNDFPIRPGDHVVVAENNGLTLDFLQDLSFQKESVLKFSNRSMASTISWQRGAGFYSSYFGPLPFTFGRVPPERYSLVRADTLR